MFLNDCAHVIFDEANNNSLSLGFLYICIEGVTYPRNKIINSKHSTGHASPQT